MDKVAAAGVQGHVVRLPVYPEIDYNRAAVPLAPPAPTRSARDRPRAARRNRRSRRPITSTKVLKPAVDYATSKNLYVDHRLPPDRQRHVRDVGRRREDVLDGHRAPVRERQQRPLRAVQRANRHKRELVRTETGRAAADRHHSRRRAQEHHHRAVQRLGPAPRRRGQRPAHRHQSDVHGPHLRLELERGLPEPGRDGHGQGAGVHQ